MRQSKSIQLVSISPTIELVTPEKAQEWLKFNTSNRNLSRSLVATYASDMLAQRWQLNGDPIRFSTEGTLLDGQHRLHAIIEAQVQVTMFVIRNLPPETFDTIDAGRKRTAADILGLKFPNSKVIASAARHVILYLSGQNMAGAVSRTEITEFVKANPYLHEAARLALRHGPLSASAIAAVIFLGNSSRQYDTNAELFVDRISSGQGLQAGDPRLAVREWAINQKIR